jgi:hypothetical protein
MLLKKYSITRGCRCLTIFAEALATTASTSPLTRAIPLKRALIDGVWREVDALQRVAPTNGGVDMDANKQNVINNHARPT